MWEKTKNKESFNNELKGDFKGTNMPKWNF